MADNKKIVLFDSKSKCCACGACMSSCPKRAISMEKDEYGFMYPVINYDICVGCGACKKSCAFQNIEETNKPIECYAATGHDKNLNLNSASGGLFASFATKILNDRGVVFGAAMDISDGVAHIHHIAIENISELYRLQGSKYVQSSTENTFKEAYEFLKQGRKVLYSGTPCQIAGLKAFLKKDYDNLILVDLICHGVPNSDFFNDYLYDLKERKGFKNITGYSFRDKKHGWGENCRIDAISKDNKAISLYMPARLDSYNTLFLDCLIFRDNCYNCKYACDSRPGDITVGDYWGVAIEQPEILRSGSFDESDGISCLIVNTKKGKIFFDEMQLHLNVANSDFSRISRHNNQLNGTSKYTPGRERIMELYLEEGYSGVEKLFKDKYKKQRVVHYIFNKLPRKVRNYMKMVKRTH